MIRAILMSLVMLSVTTSLFAEDVSLSGTVKKTGAVTGLSGVEVSLAKIPALRSLTDADGKFTITGTTAIRTQPRQVPPFQFNLRGERIIFSPVSGAAHGRMNLFSSSGRKIFSVELVPGKERLRSIILPELSSGINVMQITIGVTTFTRTLVRVGNELFMEGASQTGTVADAITLQKQAAAVVVDTLIAIKSGFSTKKFPIDVYTKSNIAIEMDSGGGKCTRESLQELVNGYLAALEAGDPSKMALATGAKYIEDLKSSSFDKGIWTVNPKVKVSFHRDYLDVDSCSAYVEMYDSVNKHAYNIGAQIRTANGLITEISALVADSGDWSIKGRVDIVKMVKISSGEKWTMIPKAQQNTSAIIKAAGDAYLDCFLDSTKVTVPWGVPCARLEGSMYTGNASDPGGSSGRCDVGIPQGLDITGRRYIIDVDMGSVGIFCKFGGGMPDSHLFRVENGKLRYAHTISIQN